MASITRKYLKSGNELPIEDDLSGAAFSLLILPITYQFHPILLADGILGTRETNARLGIGDVLLIAQKCRLNNKPLFIPTDYFESASTGEDNLDNQYEKGVKHYAVVIEWLEAAEM